MQAVKKVEIIVSTLEVGKVINILETIHVSDYMVVKNAFGKNDRGFFGNDLGQEFSNSYITTICNNDEQIRSLINELLPLLKKLGGMCLMTDAAWVIH